MATLEECAKELFSFLSTFKKMNSCGVSCETTVDFDDFDTNENDSEEDVEEKKKSDEASNSDGKAYYQDALNILADKRYHLIGAYPVTQSVFNCSSNPYQFLHQNVPSRC